MATVSPSARVPHRLKWGTIFAVAYCLLIISPFFWNYWRSITTPKGSIIPKEKPDEELRVYHPYGFSMVGPKNWNTHVQDEDTESELEYNWTISMSPMSPNATRHGAYILLELMKSEPEDLTNYEATSFQGAVAYAASGTHPGYDWEWPPSFGYRMYFQRGADWYRLDYRTPGEFDSLPPEILPYFESFKTHKCELHH